MTILLTEREVLSLAQEHLDMIQPNPDRVHDIALKMGMKYLELMDMYWDVEEYSLIKIKNANPN